MEPDGSSLLPQVLPPTSAWTLLCELFCLLNVVKNYFTNLIPWSRDLLEMLTVTQLDSALILSHHMHHGLPVFTFLLCFLSTIYYAYIVFPICTTCSAL